MMGTTHPKQAGDSQEVILVATSTVERIYNRMQNEATYHYREREETTQRRMGKLFLLY